MKPAAPIFVARERYRRRRLGDAARVLPVLGAALVLLPLLGAELDPWSTSGAKLYLFAVWLGLIIAAGLLSRALGTRVAGEAGTDPED
jgi:hypothetical protein